MITGVIALEFKDDTTEEEIQEMVSQFYARNTKGIQNMHYFEFDDPKTLSQLYEFCRKDEVKDTKETWKCPVCNAEPIDGMAVEHAKDCDYCETKMNRMLAKDKILKFEIMQPSDKCFVEGDDFKAVCIAVIVLGEGKYGLQQVDGDLHMPPVIFAQEWFLNTFKQTEKEAILEADPVALANILKTVKLAGKRDSLNDIVGRGEELVKMLEKCNKR